MHRGKCLPHRFDRRFGDMRCHARHRSAVERIVEIGIVRMDDWSRLEISLRENMRPLFNKRFRMDVRPRFVDGGRMQAGRTIITRAGPIRTVDGAEDRVDRLQFEGRDKQTDGRRRAHARLKQTTRPPRHAPGETLEKPQKPCRLLMKINFPAHNRTRRFVPIMPDDACRHHCNLKLWCARHIHETKNP